MRRGLSLSASGSLGAGLAALVIATGTWPATTHATPLRLAPIPLRDNKQHLSAAAMTELLRWARRYRSCAVRRGIAFAAPTAGRDDVVLTGPGGSRIRLGQLQRAFSCTRETGDPPKFSAFALLNSDHWLHLYRPRTCRLPVTGEATG